MNRKRELAALLFAMSFPSLMTWIEFWVLPSDSAEPDPTLTAAFILGKIVQFSFPLFFVGLVAGEPLRIPRWSTNGLLPGIGFAGVVAIGAFALYFFVLKNLGLFVDTPAKIYHWLVKIHAASPLGYLAVAIFISALHSLMEEYYWRWFVFGRLQRQIPWGSAVVVSSLAFMSHHVIVLAFYFPGRFWIAAAPFSLCVAGGGVAWAWLYHRSGSIYAPWISHLLVDAAIMMIGYDMLWQYF